MKVLVPAGQSQGNVGFYTFSQYILAYSSHMYDLAKDSRIYSIYAYIAYNI